MRDSRFDYLKLLAMFGMVTIHGIYRSGVLETCTRFSTEWIVLTVIYTLFFAMTNVFVLISSRFLRHGRIRMNKIGKIALMTTGYSTAIYMILVITGIADFSIITFVSCVLSAFTNQYWFIGAYLLLYLLIPYLNKMLESLTKQEIERLCIVLICAVSLLPTFFVFVPAAQLLDADCGKGIIWFVTMYCISWYVDQYAMAWIEKLSAWKVWLFLIANAGVLVLSRAALYYVSNLLGMAGDGETRLYFDSCCFVFGISISVYILTTKMKQVQLRNAEKLISVLAGTTLGIYLIHEQPQLKEVLWTIVPRCTEKIGVLPGVCVCAIGVFVICLFIEFARQIVVWRLGNQAHRSMRIKGDK